MLNRLIELWRRFLAWLGLGPTRGGTQMDQPTGRNVTGVFTPGPTQKDITPEEGFGLAIRNGVDLLAKQWGKGDYEVSIKLEATVNVTNPGEIGQYKAVISEP
jgi:hypothetical protein